jgi:peptidyl-prolyl cis-trans isomerase A (cyclophilin A)
MDTRFAFSALALSLLAVTATATVAAAAPPKKRAPVAPVAASYPAPKPVVLGDTVRVVLTTEMGAITIDLDHKRAPLSTENFVRYVDTRRFDGIVFYRAMRLEWGTPPNGLIQAGTRGDPRRNLPPIAHEPTWTTGIRHKAGTISMARLAPGTASGDFSIMVSDQPGLDGDASATDAEAKAGYAAFGRVVEGMDVVKAIFDAPTSPTEGTGFLKGQMIAKPVKVLTVRRVAVPVSAPVAAPPAPAL